MKKIIYIIASSALLASCSFLDVSTKDYHDTAYQFQAFDRTKTMITNVYSYLQDEFTAQSREVATDNGQYSYETNSIKKYYDGSWSPTSLIDDQWANFYAAIRSANYFIENCPDDYPASRYLDEYPQRIEQLKYYKWEARALRAYYHFELLRRYGRIIIAEKCYSMDEVNAQQQRSFQDVAEWIANECDIVAEHLPESYGTTWAQEVNRVTRNFALALKARVLLYAASPLNNPDNKTAADKAYNRKLCLRAADAAQVFFSKSQYAVEKNITFNDYENARYLIFGITRGASTGFEGSNFPIGYEGGNGGACPSDNLACCFEYADGTPFDWSNPAHMANPYVNRDPRFYRTVYYNGCPFKEVQLQTYTGGLNALPKKGATPTSYYLAKLIVEKTQMIAGDGRAYYHIWPIFRIHEMYLDYAEALFEATGNPDFTGELDGFAFQKSPLEALNVIRAGAPMPAIESGLSPEAFRARLRNERRVELAFEDHRFWDIRRWKTAPEVIWPVYGVTITKLADGSFQYEPYTEIRTDMTDKVAGVRIWDDKYYWYPIPRSETFKNENLKQNPGW